MKPVWKTTKMNPTTNEKHTRSSYYSSKPTQMHFKSNTPQAAKKQPKYTLTSKNILRKPPPRHPAAKSTSTKAGQSTQPTLKKRKKKKHINHQPNKPPRRRPESEFRKTAPSAAMTTGPTSQASPEALGVAVGVGYFQFRVGFSCYFSCFIVGLISRIRRFHHVLWIFVVDCRC